MSMLNGLEVAKHNTRESCWVVVNGKVYDVTEYLDEHPGGAQIMLQYGGKDATWAYEPIHPSGTIEKTLPEEKHLGPIDPSTITTPSKPSVTPTSTTVALTPLSHCMSLSDIEAAAIQRIPHNAYVYFHSAADSLGSLATNHADWKKITFRPRILRNVKRVDMSRRMFGLQCRYPFFIAPAARARLVHEDGELCLARTAARRGVVYCPSTYSTVEHDELVGAFEGTVRQLKGKERYGGLVFQLYVAQKKERTLELVRMARELGFKALVVTVDTPVVGKREEDERYRAELMSSGGDTTGVADWSAVQDGESEDDAPVLRGHHSSTLDWEELRWIRDAWGDAGPVALKGVQTFEDAKSAMEAGVEVLYLSNHGGRQCDDAPSSVRTLLEIRKYCPEVLQRCEVYLDGGVRRGADVLKAIALGARGVALGRPFMYACAFGDQGVDWTMKVLSEEIETTMRLIGVTSLDQLSPKYVNTKRLEMELPEAADVLDDGLWSRLKAKL